MKKFSYLVITLGIFIVTHLAVGPVVAAVDPCSPIPCPSSWLSTIGGSTLVKQPDTKAFVEGSLVGFAITLAFTIAILSSLIMLLIGGIRWIMSGGDKNQATGARLTVTHSLIGLGLALVSFAILRVVSIIIGVSI